MSVIQENGSVVTARDDAPHSATTPALPTRQEERAERLRQDRGKLTAVLALPVMFVVFLPLLFVGLMHSPTPRGVDVAVIGSESAVGSTVQTLSTAAGDSFDVTRTDSAESATTLLKNQDLRAAYNPVTGDLYIASAGGVQAATAAKTFFTQVAASSGTTVQVHDVVPLPDADPVGTSLLYIGIGAIVGGFLSAFIIGLIGATVRTRWQVTALVGMAVLVAGVETLYGWAIFDIFPGSPWPAFGVLAGIALVAGFVTLGGMKTIGPAMLMVSILVLVLLGVTSSGTAVQLDLAPGFYSAMHQILPTARGLSALRSVIYFDGVGIGGDLLVMGIWAVVGAALMVLSHWRRSRARVEPFEDLSADEAIAVSAAAAAAAASA